MRGLLTLQPFWSSAMRASRSGGQDVRAPSVAESLNSPTQANLSLSVPKYVTSKNFSLS